MPITSQITMKPVVGSNPVGYTTIATPAFPYTEFIGPHLFKMEINENELSANTVDEELNKLVLMNFIKSKMDSSYAASNYTDLARNYFIDYTVVKVQRTHKSLSSSIWVQRTPYWFVDIFIRVFTNQ